MFATAAVVDMRIKEDRRKHWDKLIEEVKGASKPASEEHLSIASTQSRAESPAGEIGSKDALSRFNGAANKRQWNPLITPTLDGVDLAIAARSYDVPLETQLKILDSHMDQVLTGLKNESEIDTRPIAKGWHEDRDRIVEPSRLEAREPRKRIHLDKMEEMVAKLVSRLWLNMKAIERRSGSSGSIGRSTEDLKLEQKRITDLVEHLRVGSTRLPEYHDLDRRGSQEERDNLNRSIESILQRGTGSNISLIVSKVCYNLLISTAPPSIDTYTLMIKHLTRLGQHRFSQIIVESFMYDSKFKPNEETVAEILYHHIASHDRQGFEATIRRLRGVGGDMRVQREFVDDLQHRRVQSWALRSKVIHRNGILHQKMPRDSRVFGALIYGCLKFSKIDRAIMFFKAAIREGCHVSSVLMQQMIDFCVQSGNAKAGWKLLSAIASQWAEPVCEHALSSLDTPVRRYIHALLEFCGINLLPEHEACQAIHPCVDRSALECMLRDLYHSELEDEIETSALSIRSMKEMIASARPDKSAALVGDLLAHMDRLKLSDSVQMQENMRKLSLRLRGSAAMLKRLEDDVAQIIEGRVPPRSQYLNKSLERGSESRIDLLPLKEQGGRDGPGLKRRKASPQTSKVVSLEQKAKQMEDPVPLPNTGPLILHRMPETNSPQPTPGAAIPSGRWMPLKHKPLSPSPHLAIVSANYVPADRIVSRRSPALTTIHSSYSAFEGVDASEFRASLA
ncbi:MAG: hypothetical protein M1818_001863 [Claussenomyces sp. TS43310]|nr:MAG: hypothetical protein M1818_001863 [Claussenomyces sp. TS43310]